ncbi:MAG: membrane protein insertion efficiency factor YidD [Parvibaculaceae bacterium]
MRRSPDLVGSLMLGLIRAYQLTLSALIGRRCRHLPTCSEYAMGAIRLHGAWRGFWLGLARVLRCHPWGSEGFDPVPETLPDHGWRFWRYGKWRLPETKDPRPGRGS